MMSEAHIRAPCGDAAAVFIYTHTLMTEMYDLYGFYNTYRSFFACRAFMCVCFSRVILRKCK
jgi:hypothetical protein